jgi:hypothetical protein
VQELGEPVGRDVGGEGLAAPGIELLDEGDVVEAEALLVDDGLRRVDLLAPVEVLLGVPLESLA